MNENIKNNQKSSKISEMLRHKAVQEAKHEKFHDALLKFNKSLCYAESDSPTTSNIFAHRADVFYRLKLFDKSLNNISLARESHPSEKNIDDLHELELKCYENIAHQMKYDDPWDFFKLSYPVNKKIPFIIDCLEVQSNKVYGRYITTNRSLKAGDILAIEEPFFKFLKVDFDDNEYPDTNPYNYCSNCLLDNYLDLIPCPGCTTTMFCSQKCMHEANKYFHRYECGILDVLKETDNFRMALRNFFVSLSICKGNIIALKKLVDECDIKKPTVFNMDLSFKENNDIELLMAVISLTNETKVKIKDMSYIFQLSPFLKRLWKEEKEFINSFLERMMQIEILNFHGIKGRSLSTENTVRRCVGDGAYAFCSLLNHSCCPNVMRIVVESRMVLIVERPIEKGEQLFDCYIGDSFYFKSKKSRLAELEDYNFLCECIACENEFPELTSGLLTIYDMQTFRLVQMAYKELQDPRKLLTVKEAKKLSKKYCSILNQSYCPESYPSKEIIMLQLCIIKCFLTAAFSKILFP